MKNMVQLHLGAENSFSYTDQVKFIQFCGVEKDIKADETHGSSQISRPCSFS